MLWVCWLVKCKTALMWWFDRFGYSFRIILLWNLNLSFVDGSSTVWSFDVRRLTTTKRHNLWQIVFAHAIVCTKCAAPRDMTRWPDGRGKKGVWGDALSVSNQRTIGKGCSDCATCLRRRGAEPGLGREHFRRCAGFLWGQLRAPDRTRLRKPQGALSAQIPHKIRTNCYLLLSGPWTDLFFGCLAAIAMLLSGLEGNIQTFELVKIFLSLGTLVLPGTQPHPGAKAICKKHFS